MLVGEEDYSITGNGLAGENSAKVSPSVSEGKVEARAKPRVADADSESVSVSDGMDSASDYTVDFEKSISLELTPLSDGTATGALYETPSKPEEGGQTAIEFPVDFLKA